MNHILVTGSHRSGTTWIGKTLSQDPRIKYIHEPFNVDYPNKEIGLKIDEWFTYAPASSQKKDIEDAFDNVLSLNPILRAARVLRHSDNDSKFSLRFAKRQLAELFFRKRYLIKDPIALLSSGWLHERYNLQIVCMIRHPLGFVGSLKKAGWIPKTFTFFQSQTELMQSWLNPFKDRVDSLCKKPRDNIEHACFLWNILHFAIIDYQRKYPSWLFVKYENIARDPVPEFQKIFDYLTLPMNDKICRYIQNYTSEKNPADSETTKYQPRNSKKSLDAWKERLTLQEIEQVMNSTKHIADKLYSDFS